MDLNFLVVAFTGLLAVLDPLAIVPVYLSLFSDEERKRAHTIALTTATATFITMVAFMFAGNRILEFLGISLAAFRVGGGILILRMGLDMLEGSMSKMKRSEGEESYSDLTTFAIIPLSIPLLAGPGAMSAIVLLSQRAETVANTFGLILILLILVTLVYTLIISAEKALKIFGRTGIRIATRIMGLMLTAMAVQFIVDGLAEIFPGLVSGLG